MTKIVCTHPGKMGDLLWSLPTINALYLDRDSKIDLITSKYCAPLKAFLEYQDCIEKVIVSEEYVAQHHDFGTQPWEMPVDGEYNEIFHLGFRESPQMHLRDYMAQLAGIDPVDFIAKYPPFNPPNGYISIAAASRWFYTKANYLLMKIAEKISLPIVWVGEKIETDIGINLTGLDFLYTASVLAHANTAVSYSSSNGVLAWLVGKKPLIIAIGPDGSFPPLFYLSDWEVYTMPVPITIEQEEDAANQLAGLINDGAGLRGKDVEYDSKEAWSRVLLRDLGVKINA
jgi:hypothetical protein